LQRKLHRQTSNNENQGYFRVRYPFFGGNLND